MTRTATLIVLLLTAFLSSCETDPYDTGDGTLSKVTTAFGEASFDSEGRAFKFVTDDEETLNFASAYGKPNEQLAGKVMRSLLYYYITDNKNAVTPYAVLSVLTTNVIDKENIKNKEADPLKVEAVWLSNNKKYLNLSLKIKSSDPKDSSLRHKLGMVYNGSENGVVGLQLIHDDVDIPQNYTTTVYFSIRMESVTSRDPFCTSIRVSAMTPEGLREYEVALR